MKTEKTPYLPTLRACLSIFRIKTAEGFQYRLAGLAGASTGIFWALLEITVYIIFYTYADNKEAGLVAGLSLRQTVSYAWLAQMLFLMQPSSIDSEILNKITSGDVGIEMCRPIDLYFHWFAKVAASRLTPLFWRGKYCNAPFLQALTSRIPFGTDLHAGLMRQRVSAVHGLCHAGMRSPYGYYMGRRADVPDHACGMCALGRIPAAPALA